VGLATASPLQAPQSALIAIGATFLLRILAIWFNWQTRPVRPWFARHGNESTMSDDDARKQDKEQERGSPKD
jgi:hypothetical protein